MPGSKESTRTAATTSRGFSASRKMAIMSLTWRRLDELQPAVLAEGDVAPGQLQFEGDGMVRTAEEHRLLPQRDSLLAVFQDRADNEPGLFVLVFAGDELRLCAAGPLGPEVFGKTLPRVADDRIGRLQDGLSAAVVLLQLDDTGAGELLGEVEDVADLGGAERIDGLGIVADDGEPLAAGTEQFEDFRLQPVGVLVLIDQDVIEAAADGLAGVRVGQQLPPEEQQVVEIEDVLLLLAVGVRLEQPLQPLLVLAEPGKVISQDLAERQPSVDAAAVDGHAGFFQREELRGLGELQLVSQQAHEVFGIPSIVDGEARRQADGLAVAAEQPHGDRVERPAPHLADRQGGLRLGGAMLLPCCLPNDRLGATEHFGGGPAGKGKKQDAGGKGPIADEVRHPARQRGGLAGPRPGDDHERAVAVLGGLLLLGVGALAWVIRFRFRWWAQQARQLQRLAERHRGRRRDIDAADLRLLPPTIIVQRHQEPRRSRAGSAPTGGMARTAFRRFVGGSSGIPSIPSTRV